MKKIFLIISLASLTLSSCNLLDKDDNSAEAMARIADKSKMEDLYESIRMHANIGYHSITYMQLLSVDEIKELESKNYKVKVYVPTSFVNSYEISW